MKNFLFNRMLLGSISSLLFLAGNSASFAGIKKETPPAEQETGPDSNSSTGEFKYFQKGTLKIDPTSDFTDIRIPLIPSDYDSYAEGKKKLSAPMFATVNGKEYIYLRDDIKDQVSMKDRLIEIVPKDVDLKLLKIYAKEIEKFTMTVKGIKLEDERFSWNLILDPNTAKLSKAELNEKMIAHEEEKKAKLKVASDQVVYSIDKNGDLVWLAHKKPLIHSYQQIVSKKDTGGFQAKAVTQEDSKRAELALDFVNHIEISTLSKTLKNIILIDQTPPRTNSWNFVDKKIAGEIPKENLNEVDLVNDLFNRMGKNHLEDVQTLQSIEEQSPGTRITNSWNFATGNATVNGITKNHFNPTEKPEATPPNTY